LPDLLKGVLLKDIIGFGHHKDDFFRTEFLLERFITKAFREVFNDHIVDGGLEAQFGQLRGKEKGNEK
jgi:hypothetical protein